MPRSYFGLDDFGFGAAPSYFGASALAQDPAQQLAQIFGVDVLGADANLAALARPRGWELNLNTHGTLQALMADALAADMMFGADDPRSVEAKKRVVHAMHRSGPSPQMQELMRMAAAHQAGKMTFSTTGEDNTSVKAEMLPIVDTAGITAGSQKTIAVRPIRSMQINCIRFPSNRTATATCRVEDISILGTSQLNGPGGIACAGLTEVRTAPILKGSTAQAGQDILVTISNPSGVTQYIEGWFEGPDLVRVT